MNDHMSQDGQIQLIGMHESLSPQLLRMIYSQTDEQQSVDSPKSLFQLLIDFLKG
ncbi:hypothetical protein [Acinetobacter sp. NCu2D-2]|uniref:hypothetical protein n=1 Tax=Acinetobacter sp. NCu2D-2 TaxID=1608473 RepID=UPI000AB312A8|nr:hypothetical protein [Acinetobacter sp. NCu2D-2]